MSRFKQRDERVVERLASEGVAMHRIYDMHFGARVTVGRKGVRYEDWLHAFAAGRIGYGSEAW